MTAPAAIQGDYVDLRFIKGRKVCQVVIEIPIEAGATFVAAFGTPNPATGIPVAIVRIDPTAKPERKPGGKLAQRAGILCVEGAFQKWVGVDTAEEAAIMLRGQCGVESRADLDHSEAAARKFRDIEASYRAWLTVDT